MSEITGTSGKKIVINAASWNDAKELKKAIEREAAAAGITLDLTQGIGAIAKVLMHVDGSDLVEAALWPCLARCTRADEKIRPETFDDLEARRDYYDIVIECLKVNLGPLVESLSAKLPAGLLRATPKASENQSNG